MLSKKLTFAVLFSTLLFTNCLTKQEFIYYKPIPMVGKKLSDTSLVSVQLNSAKKSLFVLDYQKITSFSFSLSCADCFADDLEENASFFELPFFKIKIFSDNEKKEYETSIFKRKNIPYSSYKNGVPVVDKLDTTDRMDPDILKFLNKTVNSENYLVIDGDLIKMQPSAISNLFNTSLMYEISVVVYNRNGDKVLSNHYREKFSGIMDDWDEDSTYYKYLNIAVKELAPLILSDIENDFSID